MELPVGLERSSAICAVWVAKMLFLPSDGLAFCTTLLFFLFISAKRVIGDVPQKTIKSIPNTAALRR